MKIVHASDHGGPGATLYVAMSYREFAYLKTLAGFTAGGPDQGTARTVYHDMAQIQWGFVPDGVVDVIQLKPGHQEYLNDFAQP